MEIRKIKLYILDNKFGVDSQRGKGGNILSNIIAAERRNKIAEILVTNGSIKVKEIAKMFGVSTETIRKDLIYLNKIAA